MATDRTPERHTIPETPPPTELGDPRASHQPRIRPRRLWFGFITSSVCWIALGCLDILITWRACIYQEEYGLPRQPEGAMAFYVIVSLVLLAIAILAGVTSYRNWRAMSLETNSGLQAVDRSEFMALSGIIISITLGVGIVLLAIPPFVLNLCWRAR